MSQFCPSCRGTQFEEIDDELFCTTPGCGIRIGGQKTVSETVFTGTEIRLTQEVRSSASQVTVRKEAGVKWTTYEAFNLIIVNQLDFLVNHCGAPVRLKHIVLVLWATFLSKSEVAFMDNSEQAPKLPFTSRQRDIVLLAKDMDSLPDFKVLRAHKVSRSRSRFRMGNKLVVRARPSSSESEGDSDDTEIIEDENFDTSNSLSNFSEVTPVSPAETMQQDDVIAGDAIPDESGNSVKPQIEMEEVGVADPVIDDSVSKVKSRKSVHRVPKAEKPLPFVMEEHEMNSLSQEMHKPFLGKARSKYRLRPEYIDYMDLRTTLALIFVAARFINSDIHVTDLIRWVDQGFLLYFASTRIFPDDWFLKSHDHQTFCPNASPFPEAILIRSSELVRYLEVPLAAPVEMFNLIERFLDDMNLPISMIHLIKSQSRISDVVHRFGKMRMGKKIIFRFYELHAVAVIIITLRKMFGIDHKIKSVCDQIRKLRQSDNYFCFDEWIEATKLRVLSLRRYCLPLFGNCESQSSDPSVVVAFHAQVVRNWRFLANGVSRNDAAADEDLVRLFAKLDTRSDEDADDSEIEFPGPSMRLLNDASDFVVKRLDDKPFVQTVLSLNFRSKTFDYVTAGSMFANIPYEILTPRGKTEWSSILEELPAEVTLLLQLASWLLHMTPVQLLPEIKKIEKLMFPEHFPVNRARRKRKSTPAKRCTPKKKQPHVE